MTPNVVVDIGNTRIKWGWCVDRRVAGMASLPLDAPGAWGRQLREWNLDSPLQWAVASVNPPVAERFREWATDTGDDLVQIGDYRAVPLRLAVEAPEQVGIDRLLTALAAWVTTRPRPVVVVTVGTAATIDLVDGAGTFRGGAILPGPRLMADALHRHTARLPLVDLPEVPQTHPPGRTTRDAITVGVRAAILGAAEFLVREYTADVAHPPVVITTGGGLGGLAAWPFAGVDTVRTDPTLTLEGIRLAAEALP